ncbi:phage portal protein, SPP1 family [Anaerovirgula multivorans]|uniref:Phage portal protein, SPP1 family n=1 Tax=Anaerovirgula multivorans TaxID=312168 RepID=A0A239AJ44_9FIRM|nr:phage portal protein [Anaerovirgula multivorans]SNR95665.1 phage portal protein, SPP1 family [Anaerovirgula multivorans]
MQEIINKLNAEAGMITSEIIKDIIEDHAAEATRTKKLYERYKASKTGVPIFSREFDSNQAANKINNKINNDFFSEIVDTKTGYMLGNPISYQLDKADKKAKTEITDFNLRNNIDDLDSETGKLATICGKAYRLLYIDSEGKERAMLLPPWETVLIYDRSINEPQFGMRYYTISDNSTDRTRVEWYNKTNVTYYIEVDGVFVLDTTESVNPQPHMFEDIPIIAFLNNEEEQGDCDKVLALIDAYDRALSDVNSEIEAFRLAYMAFYGVEPTLETIEIARQTGAFGFPEGTDGKFLTKDLNDLPVENHLNRLEQNILRFAKSVNFGDKEFAGNSSGVALGYKLMSLDNKVSTATRKFSTGLRQQFKVLATAWATKGIQLNYLDVFFGFTPNLPTDYAAEADTTGKLKGLVSEKTRIGLLSFVDDVGFEQEEMARESQSMVDLDDFEDDEDDEGDED